MTQPIGVYGGSFDPVHNGHLRVAWEIYTSLKLEKVLLIPSHRPPHRAQAHASSQQRVAMLELATAGIDGLSIDTWELESPDTSFTINTLRHLRQQYGADQSLVLIVGGDAFMGLSDWQDWQQLIEIAHIVVAERPGHPVTMRGELADFFANRQAEDAARLSQNPSGYLMFQPVTQLDIASSTIRQLIASGDGARFLAPDPVLTYIHQQGLYTQKNGTF